MVKGQAYNIRIGLSQRCSMGLALCSLIVLLYQYMCVCVSLPLAIDLIVGMIWGCTSTVHHIVTDHLCLLAWCLVSHDRLYCYCVIYQTWVC